MQVFHLEISSLFVVVASLAQVSCLGSLPWYGYTISNLRTVDGLHMIKHVWSHTPPPISLSSAVSILASVDSEQEEMCVISSAHVSVFHFPITLSFSFSHTTRRWYIPQLNSPSRKMLSTAG